MQQFSSDNSKELTRTTHEHDASRRAVQVRIAHAVELRCLTYNDNKNGERFAVVSKGAFDSLNLP